MAASDFEGMWRDLAPVGRSASSGGYFRQPWTSAESELRAWFAEACAAAGLFFVGPPADAIRTMGSKSAAKSLLEKAGVPLVPGYHGDRQDREMGADECVEEPFLAERIGAEARDVGHVRVEDDRDVADAPVRIAAPTLLSAARCRRRGHSRQTATKSSALSRSASPAGRSTKSEALIAGVKRS